MCRRRFFKSYFYIDYNGVKYQNGETVPVSPFPAAGSSVTITLVAARPWQITNNSWLSISSIQNKSGTHTITLTAAENQSYSSRSGSFTAKTLDDRNTIIVSFSQEPQTSEKGIYILDNPLNLGAEATGTLVCYFHYNGTTTVVTPTWSEDSSVIQVNANGVVTSNNTSPDPVNGIVVKATYVHDGDTLTATSIVNVSAATIEYRNLFVDPTSMTLNSGNTGSGKQIRAYVEEWVNGHKAGDVEVTLDATWASYNTDIAEVSRSGNNEVVRPVYKSSEFYPTQRNTRVSATYMNTAATCDVLVEPEGYTQYELDVTPSARTLDYGETFTGVEAIYYTIIDGVRVSGTNVTVSAIYTPDNSATTVSVGANNVTLTGNNTGTSDQDTVITVSYGEAESKTITVTNHPAVRDKYLRVEASPELIEWSGDSQMSAYYEEWIGNTRVVNIELNPWDVTWSIVSGGSYASVDWQGVVKGANETQSIQTVTVYGYYYEKDVDDSTDIRVKAADVPYNPYIEWLNDVIYLPAYWTEGGGSSNESFEFVDIDPSTIGIKVISGESLEANNLSVGSSDGSADVYTTSFNRSLSAIPLGSIIVSGMGLDNVSYPSTLEVNQEAGVDTYLRIEGTSTYTDARSVVDAADLDYEIEYDGISLSSLAVSGYDGNISAATVSVIGNVLHVSLNENTAHTQVTSDLYITATTVYGDTVSAHLIITQPAYVPPTCSLVWDVPYVCGSTKYVVVNAYTAGDYSQDDVVEVVGYIPENVSNISVSVLEASAGIVVGYSLSIQDEEVTFSISVNSGNSERHAIVRIEGDGADGNTYHDDLIIFQRYVEPDLLVNNSQVFSLFVDSAYTGDNYTLAWHYAGPNSIGIVSYNGFISSCTLGQKTVIGDDGTCAIMVEVAPNTGSSTYENVVVLSGTSVFGQTMIAELHIYQEHQYVPSCNLELTYSGSDPIAYNDDVVFNLSYDGDLDYSTIGYIGKTGDAVINRVTVDSARKTVTVDLDNNCSTSDRTFSIILSALCGDNVMTASSVTITQEHSNGYTVTVNEQNGFYVQVTNNLSNDIRLAGYQVYTRDDCNTTLNVFQFIGQSVTVPANSSVNVSNLIAVGHVTRPNDTNMRASASFENVPNGTNVRFNVAGYNDYTQCSDGGAEGVFTLSHPTSINDNSFILDIG